MMLRVENGSFAYRGGPKILNNINFEVSPGEILAVLGPNGSGKTTLLRCIMGMLRWEKGRSTIDGEDICRMPTGKLWRRMAYVPQAKSAAASFTAFQTVLLGRSSRIGRFSSPGKEDTDAAENAMQKLGIIDLAEKPCHAISGGEFQMVLIARAMAAEPEILILDEPESNLDFRNQLVVLDTISDLAAQGMICVFNTHYPAHAIQRADKSLILSKGGGSCFGSTPKTVTEENIRSAFGVNAKIGTVETPESLIRNVIPLSISRRASEEAGNEGGRGEIIGGDIDEKTDSEGADVGNCIASITVIAGNNDNAGRINALMHEYNSLLIGRMGMPYRKQGLYIININLDGPRGEIDELTHRLSLVPDISVKTTYARR